MRDLKFRIWDDKAKVMIYSTDFTMFYEFFEQSCWDEDKAMMFTEVIDKNGKEIYEGDIVSYCRYISNGVEQWETGEGGVVFERGCFWCGHKKGSGEIFGAPDFQMGDPALMHYASSGRISTPYLIVKGNIYDK